MYSTKVDAINDTHHAVMLPSTVAMWLVTATQHFLHGDKAGPLTPENIGAIVGSVQWAAEAINREKVNW